MQFAILGLKEFRGRFLRRSPYTREILKLRDQAEIALDWVHPGSAPTLGSPVCLLIHGVAQSSSSVTMSDLACKLADHGWPTVVMNRRGYELPLAQSSGTSTNGELQPNLSLWGTDSDVDDILSHLGERYPESKVAIIGFSAGSALSCRYVCKRKQLSAWDPKADDRRVLCSVAIDPGYEVGLSKGPFGNMPWPYSIAISVAIKYHYFLKHHSLLRQSPKHRHLVFAALNPFGSVSDTVRATMKLSEFETEEQFEAEHEVPMSGAAVPLLLINSRDDPICLWNLVEQCKPIIKRTPLVVTADMARGAHGCKHGFYGAGTVSHDMVIEFVASCQTEFVVAAYGSMAVVPELSQDEHVWADARAPGCAQWRSNNPKLAID